MFCRLTRTSPGHLLLWLGPLLMLSVPLAAPAADEARSAAERIAGRTFPSVFQAWSPAENLPDEDRLTTQARHDLIFNSPSFFGLRWDGEFPGLATTFTEQSRRAALNIRAQLLRRNPNLVLLAELRYRDAPQSYLPPGHAWWKRREGALVPGWAEGRYLLLDFANPAFQAQVAQQAKALIDTGVVDGIMLDWWQDDPDRLALVKQVREQIGETALLLVNANDRTTPQTSPYVNGYFMECYRSQTAADWARIAETLQWAETHLRAPRINCLETWYHQSRQDLSLMRATTTLSLTLSDGYCLFSDPNELPTPDHRHDWYAFWDKSLGRPLAPGRRCDDGTFRREFEHGLAVYNPLGNGAVRVTFPAPRRSAATGAQARSFDLAAGDGDLFLSD